jgi:hypothetical protein
MVHRDTVDLNKVARMLASLGPVAALAQLSKKDARPQDVQEAIASILLRLTELSTADVAGQQDVNWLIAVIKAATSKLSGSDAPTSLADAACETCSCLLRAFAGASLPETAALAAYGLMRQLVSMGQFDAGLAQGRQLQAALAASVAQRGATGYVLNMYVGSTLNLVICMAQTGGVPEAQVRHWLTNNTQPRALDTPA